MVRRILEGTEFAALPAYYINLLDAARLQKLEKLLSLPLVRDGVTASDLCVVNKMDAAPEGFRAALDEKLAALGKPAAVCFANLQDSESLPGAVAEPLRRFLDPAAAVAAAPESPAGHRHAHDHHGEPAVCAEESSRDNPVLLPGPRVAAAFDALVRAVEAAGGTVAHIKAVLAGRDGGRVFLQSTGTGEGTPADLPRDIAPARIVLNAIAWNIRPEQLRALTREFLCTCHDSSKP
jgi:G3E family GTPase